MKEWNVKDWNYIFHFLCDRDEGEESAGVFRKLVGELEEQRMEPEDDLPWRNKSSVGFPRFERLGGEKAREVSNVEEVSSVSPADLEQAALEQVRVSDEVGCGLFKRLWSFLCGLFRFLFDSVAGRLN